MSLNSELLIKINGDVKDLKNKFKQIKGETNSLNDTLKSAAKISTAAFVGFGAAIGGVVAQSAKSETIRTQFEVLTGSVDVAKKAMVDLQNFSASTPFQFGDIAKAGQKLLGFGFSVDELQTKLREVGDVSAAVGADLGELTLIVGQVAAAGKLTGERLLQMQERAIPIGPAIAKTMGVAESSVRDLVSAGKVTNEVFQKAFSTLSQEGGVAFGGMAKRSQTLSGLISTLKDNISILSNEIGQYFVPLIKSAVSGLTNFIKYVKEHPEIAKFTAILLGVGAAISGLVATLSTAGIMLISFKAAVVALGLTMKGVLVSTGIGAILVGLGLLYTYWDEVITFMQDKFSSFVETMSDLGSGLTKMLKGIFTLDVSSFKEGLNEVKESFASHEDEMQDVKDEKNQQDIDKELERKLAKNDAIKGQKDTFDAETKEKEKSNLEKSKVETGNYFKTRMNQWKAYANFEKLTNKEREQAQSDTINNLSALQRSGNAQMKAIGKSAALVQIGMSTSEGAIKAYASLAGIPLVGPALGAAAAGALIAYGAERARNVIGLETGGIVTQQTNAVIGERNRPEAVIPLDSPEAENYGIGGISEPMKLEINFTGDLAQYIEEKQVENEKLRISIQRA